MSLTPILTIAAGLLVFVGLYLLRQQIRNLFVFENIFVFGAMVFSTIMCSGYMWNQIRHPPYVGRSSPGQSGLISPGYQSQYGIETNVVAGLYLLISASFIGLSKVKSVSGLGRFVVFTILMGTFMVSYSMMMKIFKVKNGGYPFKLLF